MLPTFLLVLLAVSALGFYAYRHPDFDPMALFGFGREPVEARSARPKAKRVAFAPERIASPRAAPPKAALPKAAVLDELQWDGPIESAPAAPKLPGKAASGDLVLQRKIRDRYIAARFPCTAQSSADLENTERMIKAARLFFEEEQPDRGMELLALAIEQCPAVEALRLAQLEIAFLMRDAEAYQVLAIEFRKVHRASKAWDQVARLGRTIAPQERAFGAPAGATSHAHYGPWPDTPNWIHASWDLTGEVLAADFHRAMKGST